MQLYCILFVLCQTTKSKSVFIIIHMYKLLVLKLHTYIQCFKTWIDMVIQLNRLGHCEEEWKRDVKLIFGPTNPVSAR